MKPVRIVLLLICIACYLSGQQVCAQQSAKELKKEKKALTVVKYNAMISEEMELKKQSTQLRQDLKAVEDKKDKENAEIKDITRELKDAEKSLRDLRKKAEEVKPTKQDIKVLATKKVSTKNGIYFSIQIGAFAVKNNATYDEMVDICKTKDVDLSKRKIYINRCLDEYFTTDNDFKYEGSLSRDQTHQYKKYLIGYFSDYWEADNFKQLLRKIGVQRAWIVPHINGKRVKLEEIIKTNPALIFGSKKGKK